MQLWGKKQGLYKVSLSLSNYKSTFVAYLMPNSSLKKNDSATI